MSVAAGFAPDTMAFTGSGQTIQTGVAYNNVRVAGSAALSGPTTVQGNLTITGSSGRLDPAGQTLTVWGHLEVQNSGRLVMQGATDLITVWGQVRFNGAATSDSLLTSGTLRLWGAFYADQNASFTPTGSHTVVLAQPNSTPQLIYFPTSGAGFATNQAHFNNLAFDRPATGSTVQMQQDIYVGNQLELLGQAGLTSLSTQAMWLPSTGVVRMHSGASVTPSRIAMGSIVNDSAGGFFAPDTSVFLASGYLPSGSAFDWRTVRVAAGTLTSTGSHVIKGNLVISGGAFRLDTYASDSVAGALRTEGTGKLSMTNSGVSTGPTLAVRDSALFAGGATDSLLEGTLRVYGNFRQTGGATNFRALAPHITEFAGTGAQVITFAGTPGSLTSGAHFGDLKVSNTLGSLTLASNVFADGQFKSNLTPATVETVIGGGRTLQVRGLDADGVVFDNAVLVLDTGVTGPGISGFANVTFQNYADAATIFTIKRNAMEYLNFNNLVFPTPPPTVGYYLDVRQMTSGGNLNVTLSGTTPTAANNNNRTIITLGPYGPVVLSWLP